MYCVTICVNCISGTLGSLKKVEYFFKCPEVAVKWPNYFFNCVEDLHNDINFNDIMHAHTRMHTHTHACTYIHVQMRTHTLGLGDIERMHCDYCSDM